MPAAAAMPIMMGASTGLNFLGGLFGGPKTTSIPAPAPLFPGTQESYVKALTDAGVAPAAFQTIAEGAKTGMPTDVGPAFEAMKAASQRGIAEGRSNLIEQFGVGGLRYGSDIMKAGVDYEAQTQKDFASILAGYTQQAQEAAANRRLQSAAMGQQATGELATAFRPTAMMTQGSGLSQGLQAGGQGLMNFMMMKALFPNLFQAGQTGGGFGDIVGNLPGSIGTGDVFPTPPFVNPGSMALTG